MQSVIHSTCCSIDTTMFVSTDGLPGPGDDEQVREAGDAEAEVGARTGLPRVREGAPVAAADVDPQQRAGHRVEAGGEHDRVELAQRPRWCGCPSGVISSIGVSRRSTR